MTKKVFRLLLSFGGFIVALLVAHGFNIFDYMTFVPEDKKYDVCIAVYFAVMETGITFLYDGIVEQIAQKKTYIEAVFHLPTEFSNSKSVPIIKFNDMGIAEVKLNLMVKGCCSNLINNGVMIRVPQQVDAQFSKKGVGIKQDNQGNLLIMLDEVCRNREVFESEEDYKITFMRRDYDNKATISLSPELLLKKKDRRISFVKNEAKMVLEEK